LAWRPGYPCGTCLEKVAGCLTGCHACLLPLSKAWPPLFLLQVTYPLHIILRYEVERGLLDGSIKVDDVPQVWNAKMKQYLGVEPDSDAQGCLQVRSRCVCLSAETLNALHLLGAQHGQSSATTSACQLRVGGGGQAATGQGGHSLPAAVLEAAARPVESGENHVYVEAGTRAVFLALDASAALRVVMCVTPQDVHWSAGLFGYFPTYSLGAM
jgi:hypothetical protein